MTRPSVAAGSTSLSSRSIGSLRLALPITGNSRQCSANTSRMKMPETNTGNDSPISDSSRAA